MLRRYGIGVVVGLGLLAVPAIAFAALALPKSGHWNIQGGGGFKISKKYVSSVTMPGSNCSLAEVTVLGSQKLREISAGGYSNWVIGTGDPSRKNPNDISGVVGLKVKIRTGGKKMSARLEMLFAELGNAKENSGDLRVFIPGNTCDIPFDMERR